MQIIISDGCYLRSLQEAALGKFLTCLPYKVAVPDVVFADSDTGLCEADKGSLLKGGVEVLELPGDDVLKAVLLRRRHPCLTVNHSFAFVLAENNPESLLLTDNKALLTLAEDCSISTKGILWLLREMYQLELVSDLHLREVLPILQNGPVFNLSQDEVRSFEKRLD